MATEVFPKVIPGVIFSIQSQKEGHQLSRAPSWETFLALCISHKFVLMTKFRKPFSVSNNTSKYIFYICLSESVVSSLGMIFFNSSIYLKILKFHFS